jgi:hypothetical protein
MCIKGKIIKIVGKNDSKGRNPQEKRKKTNTGTGTVTTPVIQETYSILEWYQYSFLL